MVGNRALVLRIGGFLLRSELKKKKINHLKAALKRIIRGQQKSEVSHSGKSTATTGLKHFESQTWNTNSWLMKVLPGKVRVKL